MSSEMIGQLYNDNDTLQLNMKSIENLLRMLSQKCRTELETVLGSQIELNSACKEEIQRIVVATQEQKGEAASGISSYAQGEDSERPNSTIINSLPPFSPGATIFGFIIFIIVTVLVYIALCNTSQKHYDNIGPKKARKLSKKKEEKLRQKSHTTH